jgi:hypothetical protein
VRHHAHPVRADLAPVPSATIFISEVPLGGGSSIIQQFDFTLLTRHFFPYHSHVGPSMRNTEVSLRDMPLLV